MIDVLTGPVASDDLDGLATLLMDAVASGASVSFMNSLEWPAARAWWERELVATPPRGFTLLARDAGGIAGCVVLKPAWAPNQPHRAEVCKLLVHRRARGRGLARALMAELERRAWDAGFTLLTLDTVPGRPADALYRSAGWTPVGVVPGYALDPDGSVCDTMIFYKAAPATPRARGIAKLMNRKETGSSSDADETDRARLDGIIGVHGVRYQVKDVARAMTFYTEHLGFKLEHQHLPAFASVSLGAFMLLLSGPGASGSRPIGGKPQEPGGWNRLVLRVTDLPTQIEALGKVGVRFRNQMEVGPGGRQIQLEDPDGNPIELFEPAR